MAKGYTVSDNSGWQCPDVFVDSRQAVIAAMLRAREVCNKLGAKDREFSIHGYGDKVVFGKVSGPDVTIIVDSFDLPKFCDCCPEAFDTIVEMVETGTGSEYYSIY